MGEMSGMANINIIFTLNFPPIIQLPLLSDEFLGSTGFAYPGSNPSYEIKTSLDITDLEITSAEIIDSSGTIFENVDFKLTRVQNIGNQFIISFDIPEELSIGKATFNLNLSNGEILTGEVEIINAYENVKTKTIKNPKKRTHIDKPVIDELISRTFDKKLSITLLGSSFVSRQIYYSNQDSSGELPVFSELFFANPEIPNPHTAVTIFPSTLNATVIKRIVRKNGKLMKIIVKFPEDITEETNAVIVITTPVGIVSKSFVIKPRSQKTSN